MRYNAFVKDLTIIINVKMKLKNVKLSVLIIFGFHFTDSLDFLLYYYYYYLSLILEVAVLKEFRGRQKDKERDGRDLGHSVRYSVLAHVSAEKKIRSVYVKLLIIASARERERARETEYLRT